MSRWKETTLGKLGRIVTGKTPLTLVTDNFGGAIPFVTPTDMDGRKTISSTLRSLTEKGAASVKGSRIPAGSVMVSCIGSDMGKAAIAGRGCVTNQQINSIVVDGEFCGEYVYYDLSTRKAELQHIASGAAQPILNKGHFSEVGISLPPLPEQKAIAAVLGALDDKIELNRRMNATLEAMARALFQSWFVDFDPVRAKAEGRAPAGLDEPTAALFPAQFQDSELGEIPQGWEVLPLGDLLDTLETGRRPKGGVGSYQHGVPSVGAESIHRVGQFDSGKTKFVPEDFFATMKSGRVQSYDVLLYKDGGKPGVFLPRVSMFGEGFPFETYAINEHVFRMRSEKIGQPLLYFQLGGERLLLDLHNRGGKAAIPGINQSDVRTLQFLMPSAQVAEAFNRTCYPLLKAILYNAKQSRTLATLRDALLPKLLSGELSVHDALKPSVNFLS